MPEKKKGKHGGSRPGSGRPPGVVSRIFVMSNDLLKDNKEFILARAIHHATKNGKYDSRVLCKLLDKLYPSLQLQRVLGQGGAERFTELSDDDARRMAREYSAYMLKGATDDEGGSTVSPDPGLPV